MAKGFKHGGGGSAAASLNFKVVGGAYSPSAPGENTIWVNTAAEITGWVISPVEPVAGEGKVWITVGTASAGGFNALKKNVLMVYPIGAKQYVDGAWVNKAAEIYQDGQWRGFSVQALYLYQPGDQDSFVAEGMSKTGSGSDTAAPAVTYGESSAVILPGKRSSVGTFRGGIIRTAGKIDCSGFSTLTFEGTVEGIAEGTGELNIWSEMGSAQITNRVKYASLANGSAPVAIDVSDLDGSYYIGMGFDSSNVQIMVTMTALRLE